MDENSEVASSFADSRMGLHSLRTARFDGFVKHRKSKSIIPTVSWQCSVALTKVYALAGHMG